MEALSKYHQTQLRLRAIARKRHAGQAERSRATKVLQQYYDLKRLSPGGIVDVSLEQEALKIEAEYAAEHQRLLSLRNTAHEYKKSALAAIGKHFGGLAKNDERDCPLKRARRWWQVANQYRKSHLDGIALHCCSFDSEGPMFKAFCKASGLKII